MEQPPAAAPQHSPDGNWWWDGERWIPAPPAFKKSGITGKDVVLAALIVLVPLGTWAAIAGAQDKADAKRDSHDAYCESFGADDPDCY